jgi:vitamin B12 transporter
VSLIVLYFLYSLSLLADVELLPVEVSGLKELNSFSLSDQVSIEEEELQNHPIGLISTDLEKIPGVIASQNGGPGGRISFFIRGTESRHVSFILDGLKINDTSNTDRQFDSSFFTSPFLKKITVSKGPQAVLYGSDAMGGLIELNTRKGERAPETRLNISGGSFGTISSSLSNDWKTTKHNGSITYSTFHSDGLSRLNKKRFNAKEQDATDITQVLSSSEHRWANKTQSDLLAGFLRGKSEQDGFSNDNSHDYSRNDQYLIQQKTNLEVYKEHAISLRSGLNRHQRLNDSLVSQKEFFNGDLYQNEFLYRIKNERLDLLSGVSSEHEKAKANELDRSFDLHSLFLQSALDDDFFKFYLGGRIDRHSKYGEFKTGSVGISAGELSFQYSEGYKAPSLYQLYGPDSFGSPVGNPNLIPETNHSLELMWKKSTDHFESSVTAFQNRLSNLFTYIFGQGYINQQRFIAEGVELNGKIKDNLYSVSMNFTHQNFKDEESPVLRRPYNSASGNLSYFPSETIEVYFLGRWYSSRKDINAKLNGFEVFDLGMRKKWSRDELSIQLKNIFDREYEELYGFSVLGQSVFTGYEHRF